MSDQDNGQVSTLRRPITNDPKAWKAYWEKKELPSQAKSEIDTERQSNMIATAKQ